MKLRLNGLIKSFLNKDFTDEKRQNDVIKMIYILKKNVLFITPSNPNLTT